MRCHLSLLIALVLVACVVSDQAAASAPASSATQASAIAPAAQRADAHPTASSPAAAQSNVHAPAATFSQTQKDYEAYMAAKAHAAAEERHGHDHHAKPAHDEEHDDEHHGKPKKAKRKHHLKKKLRHGKHPKNVRGKRLSLNEAALHFFADDRKHNVSHEHSHLHHVFDPKHMDRKSQMEAWNHLMVDRERRRREGHEGRVLQMNSEELSKEELAEARDARSHGESVMVVDHGDHSHLLLLGPDHPPTSAAFLGVFAFMIACQVGIFSWKRNRPHSFMLVTLVGLWVVPFLLSVSAGHTRFLLIWFLFSCSTAYITMRALKRPLEKNVPQLVYTYFLVIYKVCFFMAVVGYILVMASMFGAALLFGESIASAGVLLLFYGLYFGVMGRDFAEAATERMANNIGYYNKEGIPAKQATANTCILCDDVLNRIARPGEPLPVQQKVFKLACGHQFHEPCIRGWLMVGKKDMCPQCSEKVDLRRTFTNPWETGSLAWAQILDLVRYLVVWQPILLVSSQLVLYAMGFGS